MRACPIPMIAAARPISQAEPDHWHTKPDKSTLTVEELEEIRRKYQIPLEIGLRLPTSKEMASDVQPDEFSLYKEALRGVGDRRDGYDNGGVLLLLQGLRSAGDLSDSASSGRSGSSGWPAIFREGVEAEMVLRVGERWGRGLHNMESPHEIGGAKVRRGGRGQSKKSERVEGGEGSEVGRVGPTFNVVCPELGTATVRRGSYKGGNGWEEESGGGGEEVVRQGGKIQGGAIRACPKVGGEGADPTASQTGRRQRPKRLRPSAAPSRPTEGEGQAGGGGGYEEAKKEEGGCKRGK
ncbi:uncharacterized protein LOC114264966 [Camellia sinensis]|uniref:uncharacterized protein LOC114264966 n=1 Tax=Camellia sinensis TaxID=4442 RepID=UPI0010365779|nr:uncharacterized protein LOC114264966 [Camellia sinensis]